LKRSNRLVLLVGVFLAVIAFVGVLLLSQQNQQTAETEPTVKNVVIAAEDIPLGTAIEETMLRTEEVPIDAALPGAYEVTSQAIGQIARQEVIEGQQITTATTGQTGSTSTTSIDTPAGYRAMSVMVDQLSGVGTLIKPGDWVDMVIRMDIKPVVVNEDGTSATAIDAVDGDTSKLLLQGMQVLGTLLPPPPAAAQGATPTPGTNLSERQELVILGLTPSQVEVVKWAQNDAQVSMSLVLRSPDDFVDAEGNRLAAESPCLTTKPIVAPTPTTSPAPGASATPIPPIPCEVTPGIVLDSLIRDYGVLVVDIEGGVLGGSVPTTPPGESPAPEESPAVSPAP
jgi:Flp pilus assembly protein CpaB